MLNEIKQENLEYLYKAVAMLNTAEECKKFLEDLCTVNELTAISQRLGVAKLLSKKHVYNDIVKLTGASTATISRTNRSLQYSGGGYELAFERVVE